MNGKETAVTVAAERRLETELEAWRDAHALLLAAAGECERMARAVGTQLAELTPEAAEKVVARPMFDSTPLVLARSELVVAYVAADKKAGKAKRR